VYSPAGVGQYKRRVREFIRENQDHITIAKLRMNKQMTPGDLEALERLLFEAGGQGEDPETFQKAFENDEPNKLGVFIRKIVGLDESAAREAFGVFLSGSTYSADQIHFINQIISYLTKNGVIDPKILFQAPFTDLASKGVAGMFEGDDAKKIIEVIRFINHNAEELKASG
jgi:type I restriction enzyme R subunit